MLMIKLLLMLLGFAVDPAAWADYQAQGDDAPKHIRYITTASMPQEMQAAAKVALSFWCNSLSSRRRIAHPVQVGPALYRVDFRDYGWTDAAWTTLGSQSGYQMLTDNTSALVVRLGTFLKYTSNADTSTSYYDFLYGAEPPKTLAEFQTIWGANLADSWKLNAITGHVIEDGQSGIARNNRNILTAPTLTGGLYYETQDVSDKVGNVGTSRLPDNLGGSYVWQAGEAIANLPNGLQAYILADGQGNIINAAVPDVVKVEYLYTGRRCVDCHGATGIISPAKLQADCLTHLNLSSVDKATANRVSDVYLSDVKGLRITDGQETYKRAIAALLGPAPAEVEQLQPAAAFLAVLDWYSAPVTLEQAAAELACDPAALVEAVQAVAGVRVSLVALAAGIPQPRDWWEREGFAQAVTLIGDVQPKGEADDNE